MFGYKKHNTVLSVLAGSIAILASSTDAISAEISKPKAVIELFTSQGCHSCPPADKLISKFAREGEVLGLSMHVNYWDYLGWKDSFASESITKRQYQYGRAMGEGQVYTPQAIINGSAHTVGSDERRIKSMIDQQIKNEEGLTVPINVDISGDKLSIGIENGALKKKATLYMVFFNKEHTVSIANGENGGKKLTYTNVVHDLQPMAVVDSSGFQMDYPMTEIERGEYDSCAIILQTKTELGDPGSIVGAITISNWN